MANQFKTDQEEFWAGEFGDSYIGRNEGEDAIASNVSLFSKILARCQEVNSLIEFGANIGLNLRAISYLRPQMELSAIEINQRAVDQLRNWGRLKNIYEGSIFDFQGSRIWDIALIKGVLIHINPSRLPQVYESLFQASRRFIFVVEYYNPVPVEIVYRQHTGKLFKRDFAGEMLDMYPSLQLVDYGFVWHRDPVFPQDDLTWFILEKVIQEP